MLLPIGLAFIMFSLGLGLTVNDFGRVLAQPVAIALGLLAQVILLPLTAFALTRVFALDATSSVGLMVLAACPGGVTAGMVTRLAYGDTALSITLTALTSMLAFLTVPLIVGGSLDHFLGETTAVQLPAGQAVGGLFIVTLMPVTIGLLLRERGRLSEATRALIHRAATMTFIAIVVFTFVDLWEPMRRNFATLGVVVLSLNVMTMTTGALIASGTKLNTEGRIALAMECGIQNSALGITVAVVLLANAELAIPSILYALMMNVTAFAVIAIRQITEGTIRRVTPENE